jgi:hypothetical protein
LEFMARSFADDVAIFNFAAIVIAICFDVAVF